MPLFYSAGSPFARIVRIALVEVGLDAVVGQHEIMRAQLYSPESAVLSVNPIGRVPALQLDDGTVLTESKLILDYTDANNSGDKLLPRDGSDGWRTLAAYGQALGVLESVIVWLRSRSSPERRRPDDLIHRESIRLDRAASSLDADIARGAYQGPIGAAQIALGTALGVAEHRLLVWNWRCGRPDLSARYDAIAARPSFKATEPPP